MLQQLDLGDEQLQSFREFRQKQRACKTTATHVAPLPTQYSTEVDSETSKDLIEFEESGVGVSWPGGVDIRVAKIILLQRSTLR